MAYIAAGEGDAANLSLSWIFKLLLRSRTVLWKLIMLEVNLSAYTWTVALHTVSSQLSARDRSTGSLLTHETEVGSHSGERASYQSSGAG